MLSPDKQPDTTRIDKRVAEFILVRDKIAALEAEHDAILAPYRDLKQKLTDVLLEALDRAGLKSARTGAGTVTVTVRDTAPLMDADAFIDFVFENDLRELLDRRANATACKDYAIEHGGALPPGVKINSRRSVGVTRS